MHGRPIGIAVCLVLTFFVAFAGVCLAEDAVATIEAEALLTRIDAGDAPLILDVRSADEYASGHVPGAVHIPYDEVAGRIAELGGDRSREIVVYCESGRRAGRAQSTLQEKGFTTLVHLEGDMRGWREKSLRCEGEICEKTEEEPG